MLRGKAIDLLMGVAALAALATTGLLVRSEWTASVEGAERTQRRDVGEVPGLANGGHFIGSGHASDVLITFSDFQCPFCQRLDASLRELQARRPGLVSIRYRHFPLAGHTEAFAAAVASECASETGRFSEYAKVLFEKQDSIGRISWNDFAVRAGVSDTITFSRCRQRSQPAEAVRRDIAVGRSLGLEGTPAIIIHGRLIVGAVSADTLEALVLAAKGKTSRAR
jgi:protein-disulfide isomerase